MGEGQCFLLPGSYDPYGQGKGRPSVILQMLGFSGQPLGCQGFCVPRPGIGQRHVDGDRSGDILLTKGLLPKKEVGWSRQEGSPFLTAMQRAGFHIAGLQVS